MMKLNLRRLIWLLGFGFALQASGEPVTVGSGTCENLNFNFEVRIGRFQQPTISANHHDTVMASQKFRRSFVQDWIKASSNLDLRNRKVMEKYSTEVQQVIDSARIHLDGLAPLLQTKSAGVAGAERTNLIHIILNLKKAQYSPDRFYLDVAASWARQVTLTK